MFGAMYSLTGKEVNNMIIRVFTIKSLKTKVLQIGSFRFNIMFGKFWFRLNIFNDKALRGLSLPVGFVYKIPIDRLTHNKEFKILHPFGKWIFNNEKIS